MDLFGSDDDQIKDSEKSKFVDAPTLFIGDDQNKDEEYFEGLKNSTIATEVVFADRFSGWDLAIDALRHNHNITTCHFTLSYGFNNSLQAVADYLSFSQVKQLNLVITPLDDYDLQLHELVANAIKNNKYIEDITIGSGMERTIGSMKPIFHSVKAHPTIKMLSVISYSTTAEDMKMLVDVVKNSNITTICLSGTPAADSEENRFIDFAEQLVGLTRVNKKLTCLELAEGFAEKPVRYLLDGLVSSNNQSLEELNLCIGSMAGCEKNLAQFFTANLPLKSLGLRAVTIMLNYLPEILEGLSHNTHLKKLDLRDNTYKFMDEVLLALKNNQSITSIDFRGNTPSEKTVDLVADVLKNNNTLRAIHFQAHYSQNPIWDSLKHNQSLTELTIRCKISIMDLTALRGMLEVNRSLTKITLESAGLGNSNPEMISDMFNLIRQCTERNKLEQRLNVTNTLQLITTISKSTSFIERLPKEIWRIVFSFVAYPGVVMDFSSKI